MQWAGEAAPMIAKLAAMMSASLAIIGAASPAHCIDVVDVLHQQHILPQLLHAALHTENAALTR